jgi:hypothetical protein
MVRVSFFGMNIHAFISLLMINIYKYYCISSLFITIAVVICCWLFKVEFYTLIYLRENQNVFYYCILSIVLQV